MRRRFGSVRARATLGATLVVAVALLAAGTAVLLSLRSNLTGQAGGQAERSARAVAAQVAVGAPYEDLSAMDDDDRPVQILDARGSRVAASEELERIGVSGADEDSGEDLDPGEIGDETDFADGFATVDGDTADYRFAAVQVRSPEKGPLTVQAGAPLAAEQSAVRTALTVLLVGFPLLLAVVAGVTWLVTRRALRPVEGIRREMAAITASADLARRVPEPDAHDEVARLARTTNETLAALETSVERQRRFVADASHELRSPIASLRTQLEVGAAHPELLDVAGAVEDTVRLQNLAADLLLLARLDAGERPADGTVELTALARAAAAGRPDVTVVVEAAVEVEAGETAGAGAVVEVAGSRGQLGRVLANLLDNAQRHARSAVAVTVRREGEWAVVEVADDGDGVPEADRERVFERFVRLDDARSRDDGGAGLGLAIARDVTVRHGGTLTLRRTPAGGALFELRLPVH
ncbi:HAMP domain-containing histidine kinase [Streptomyces sp. NBC_01275]|uniref:sensor histidine kinase n=1 Tax=Streptomyces sp. NBC_01275 TaxID=2903807 RepID=UPI0022576BD4|nr:HAMP domain-containing sensor histidine kinase [Streptomyces sp. NBC_01275]MCX4765032.1 HAMP domain-containing histidine kinase [Streptomyces sp. NBC_01275]